ncbi:UNVERIFIED_CONTAM: hypothetical protein PYX00_001438 [Menopon gallinae]|uniref:Uncharacterized protein n=1 Tax=Menopon gallinae TaxID=328185 RepID=A0AAW2ICM6_9NEOP
MPEKKFGIDAAIENGKMKDANGSNSKSDERKLIQDQSQKTQANDIKCAEIKAIPSVLYGERERQRFKIGEYNRATASFEINTPPNESAESGPKQTKLEFDLTSEINPSHYFKSNFARSMVVNNASKSLDYALLNRNGHSAKEDRPKDGRKCKEEDRRGEGALWQLPGKENWDLRKAQPAEIRDDVSSTGSFVGDHQTRNKVRNNNHLH